MDALMDELKGKRVLLADDMAVNRRMMERFLCAHGCRVDLAGNGRQAVELYLTAGPGEYDAVLMDIQMPEMDGWEATRAIRASGRPDARAVPIVALTSRDAPEDRARCRESGMDCHMRKPYDPQRLLSLLLELTGGCR